MSTVIDIVKYFRNGHYFDCLKAIERAKTAAQTVVDKLIFETNAAVCQLMENNSNEKSLESLASLAKEAQAVPLFSDRPYRLLLLQLSSNVMYLSLVCKNFRLKYLDLLLSLLVTYLGARHIKPSPEFEHHRTPSRQLIKILEELLAAENESPEFELLNYLKALTFILHEGSEGNGTFFKRTDKENLTAEPVTRLPILFLSPLHLRLVITHEDVSSIVSFSRLVATVAEFGASSVQVLSSPCDQILLKTSVILKALQLLKHGRPEDCAAELVTLNYSEQSSPSSLAFFKRIISAAAMSSVGQNNLALQHLRIAVSSPLARHAPYCAAVLVGMATQFSQLNQKSEELESWRLALDCLSQPDPVSSGIHDDFPGFLFTRLNIFPVDVHQIRYTYSRRLLELKEYEKAAQLFEESLSVGLASSSPWSLFRLEQMPADSVRLREYLVCLFMSSNYRKVANVCDQHYLISEDFVVPLIDGLARARDGQWKEALKSLNKAVIILNSQTSLADDLHSAVLCRLHLNRAQVLEQLHWVQDCFHALRLALQAAPDNAEVLVYYEKFCQQQGFAHVAKLELVNAKQTCVETDDFVIQWILSESALAFVKK